LLVSNGASFEGIMKERKMTPFFLMQNYVFLDVSDYLFDVDYEN